MLEVGRDETVASQKPGSAKEKKLAKRIAQELKRADHCGVYEPELSRVWPLNGKRRETQIVAFAEEHGWRLRLYREGFCAIFDKQPRRGSR